MPYPQYVSPCPKTITRGIIGSFYISIWASFLITHKCWDSSGSTSREWLSKCGLQCCLGPPVCNWCIRLCLFHSCILAPFTIKRLLIPANVNTLIRVQTVINQKFKKTFSVHLQAWNSSQRKTNGVRSPRATSFSLPLVFSRGHATLKEALSVGPSVRLSVRQHESKSGKTRISAPAHPSATGIGRVSGLVSLSYRRHFWSC